MNDFIKRTPRSRVLAVVATVSMMGAAAAFMLLGIATDRLGPVLLSSLLVLGATIPADYMSERKQS